MNKTCLLLLLTAFVSAGCQSAATSALIGGVATTAVASAAGVDAEMAIVAGLGAAYASGAYYDYSEQRKLLLGKSKNERVMEKQNLNILKKYWDMDVHQKPTGKEKKYDNRIVIVEERPAETINGVKFPKSLQYIKD